MRRRLLLSILGGGLLLRVLLGFVAYPGQGFAGDVNLFLQWSNGIADRGPGGFYGADSTANYPPVSVYALWAVHVLAAGWASVVGGTPAQALVLLVKVPAIVADIGTGWLAYVIGRDLHGIRSGLVAAALCCLVPPPWYTSALWGQIDSFLLFFSLLALTLLIRGHSELAAIAAVGAVLVKPQGIVVVLVVGVVLMARHLSTAGGRRRPARLLSSIAAAAVAALLLIVPFDYQTLAPGRWAHVPLLGDMAGFVAQSLSTSQLFPVLTANAYNVWALVGDPSLVRSIGTGTSVWSPDSVPVWGIASGVVGIVLLGLAVSAVVVGLVVRHDAVAVLFGYVVLSFALFVLPTRSHERYLLPVFAAGAVLAAPHIRRVVAYLAVGLVNLVNLHAVLAGPLGMITQTADQARSGGRAAGERAGSGGGPAVGDIGRPPGSGSSAVPGDSGPGASDPGARATDISLPFGSWARSEWVAVTVSVLQTSTMVALLLGWVAFVTRARALQRLDRAVGVAAAADRAVHGSQSPTGQTGGQAAPGTIS